jgi:hypothetical protein
VVFDVGSGQTHQMDTLTAATLLAVEACAGCIDQLVSRIASELTVTNDHELSNAVRGVLERLATTGLIESTLQ